MLPSLYEKCSRLKCVTFYLFKTYYKINTFLSYQLKFVFALRLGEDLLYSRLRSLFCVCGKETEGGLVGFSSPGPT